MSYLKSRYGNFIYMLIGLLLFGGSIIAVGTRTNNIVIIFFALISFLCYYLFDIFDITSGERSKRTYIYPVVINLFFAVILVAASKWVAEMLVVYLIQMIYQTVVKYIVYKFIFKVRNIVVIGDGEKGKAIAGIVSKIKKYKLSGIVSTKENNINSIGNLEKIEEVIEKHNVEVVIITDTTNMTSDTIDKILALKMEGLEIYDYLQFFEKATEKVPLNAVDAQWFLFSEGYIILGGLYQRLKRIFDIGLSMLILIPSLPVMAVSAVIIKLESKGPIFFTQERIGKGGEPFEIIKFRSMTTDAEKDGPQWAKEKDNRVTVFGGFMRKTRIDELPQLFNILRGDMSFIGPRPERDHFIKMLEKEIPFYNLRHIIKPGLTGWAQVNYPYGASVQDAYEKLQYDLYYIKNYSVLLDIMILFMTAKTVLFGKGR